MSVRFVQRVKQQNIFHDGKVQIGEKLITKTEREAKNKIK